MGPIGIKSFFTPKVSKEKEVVIVDNSSTSSNENSSSSSNITITIDGKPNTNNNIKDSSSKPIHPLFQKAVKKDVINLNSSSKPSDSNCDSNINSNSSQNSMTPIITINTSGRPKRSCTQQSIINITNDDDDEYEDPFVDIDDENPKKQSKANVKEKDHSIGITYIHI